MARKGALLKKLFSELLDSPQIMASLDSLSEKLSERYRLKDPKKMQERFYLFLCRNELQEDILLGLVRA
jgi:hypothetical protein